MCTVVVLFRPRHDWPVLIAANRDEALDRPWDAPARHWPDRSVVAGRDCLANGSWLGLNDDGVAAAILNGRGSLGPAAGKRSRGELTLEALDHADAADAASALRALARENYRPFSLLIADDRDVFWLANDGSKITLQALEPGLSMLTESGLNNPSCPRTARHLADFAAAPTPDPEQGDWRAWCNILVRPGLQTPQDGMTIVGEGNFGTLCRSLIALPGRTHPRSHRRFLFAPSSPAHTDPSEGCANNPWQAH